MLGLMQNWPLTVDHILALRPGERATREEILGFLEGKIARWWMPDDVLFVDEIRIGVTGKINKKWLRELYGSST
jgi:fatty-acyl-CoA synthase